MKAIFQEPMWCDISAFGGPSRGALHTLQGAWWSDDICSRPQKPSIGAPVMELWTASCQANHY